MGPTRSRVTIKTVTAGPCRSTYPCAAMILLDRFPNWLTSYDHISVSFVNAAKKKIEEN